MTAQNDLEPTPAPDAPAKRHGRGPLWLAIAVAIVWLIIGGIAGPISGKLNEVQKNDNASFLPASAESTIVADEQAKFNEVKSLPALVVVSNPAGGALTAGQKADAAKLAAEIPGLPIPGGTTIADYLEPGPIVPIPSEDGNAILINVPVNADKATQRLPNGELALAAITASIREAAAAYPDAQINVTGPGGILSDLFKVFGAIDTQLLGITALVVAVILIFVYRSPFLWLIPLLSAAWALTAASVIVYFLAKNDILVLSGQSQGILTVLVFGAGTDYALLLVARYREELHHYEWHVDAMKATLKGVSEPIIASAATVCIGLMCLLLSELNSNRSIGPVGAAGILAALLVMLTLLPALLVIVGRRVFWPRIPRFGEADEKLSGFWSKLAASIGRRPRLTWIATGLVLLILAGFTSTLKADGITTTQAFVNRTDSVIGQEVLADHFAGGLGTPTIIMANEAQLAEVLKVAQETPGVASVFPYTGGQPGDTTAKPVIVDGRGQLLVTLDVAADSSAAGDTVVALRDRVHAVSGAAALVGGQTAAQVDVNEASRHDRNLIIPIVLAVIFLILVLLLRAIVAPVLLIVTVVLSYFATLGVCALLFNHVFGFAGADTSFPLFAFVFLVALGVDYNIFLMTRVREESKKIGTRPGILKGLTVTGGVITSAGIVLAATFLVLGVLPLVFLRELGIAVAIGVLLDTFIVRSTLVPALAYDIGSKIWWPSSLAKAPEPEAPDEEPELLTV
ncbi:MAG: MMPL family transporter [Actinomycetes bacterium]